MVMRGFAALRALVALVAISAIVACAPGTPAGGGATPGGAAASAPTAANAAAGAATPQKGGTLVVAFNADPETFDPHVTTALFATRAFAQVYNNLIERDYDGSFKPGIATSWDVSPDGTAYSFHLRQGVKFHSGKTLSSADVKYTFERWLSIQNSPSSFAIKPIDHVLVTVIAFNLLGDALRDTLDPTLRD